VELTKGYQALKNEINLVSQDAWLNYFQVTAEGENLLLTRGKKVVFVE